MRTLLEVVQDAEERGVAIGHFNFATEEQFWGIANAARKLKIPVVFGVSEGERQYVGLGQAVALVRSLRDEGLEVYLNADHTYDLEKVREAAEAGVDSVIFDGAKLSYEENVLKTKEAVEIVRSVNSEILIEAELGYIGQSSKVLKEVPDEVDLESLPTPEQAREFVEKTGVDMLAPAVGNIHGMFGKAKNPRLQIDLIREIRKVAGIPLVLHGGSGVTDEDFAAAIRAGISLIHISTELRVAWRKGLEDALKDHPDEIAPYKILGDVVEDVEKVVEERIKLFMS